MPRKRTKSCWPVNIYKLIREGFGSPFYSSLFSKFTVKTQAVDPPTLSAESRKTLRVFPCRKSKCQFSHGVPRTAHKTVTHFRGRAPTVAYSNRAKLTSTHSTARTASLWPTHEAMRNRQFRTVPWPLTSISGLNRRHSVLGPSA